MAGDNEMVNSLFGDNYGNSNKDSDWTDFAEQNKLKITSEKHFLELKAQLEKKFNLSSLKDQMNNANLSKNEKLKLEKEYEKKEKQIREQATAATRVYEVNSYAQASAAKKVEMLQQEQEALQTKKSNLDKELQLELEMAEAAGKDKQEILDKYAEKEKQLNDEIRTNQKTQNNLNRGDQMKSINQFKSKMQQAWKDIGDVDDPKGLVAGVGEMVNAIKDFSLDDVMGDIDKAKKAAESDLEISKGEYDEMLKNGASEEELVAKQQEIYEKDKQSALLQTLDGITKSMDKMTKMIGESYNAAFREAENILTTYSAHINARLQGSEKTYKSAMNKISSNLFMNPFVKTQEVISAMRDAVDKGIIYNLEQRAFLSQISDKIANTFDVFDSNLLRLIRLQQADTTAARLGMEAALTNFLNEMFEDSSYLNNGNSQAIAGMLIDASSTMTKEASAEFEFVVQKWMGSLTSVGIDSNTVNTLVQAINYLATGDVESLASNTQIQTLLTMSASKAGLDYSKMLLNGLNASDTNKLLSSMVEYLKTIAEGSENMVVRAAYGDVFGMSMSDFSAISNLRKEDISAIENNMMSYNKMNTELNKQFALTFLRTTIPEMLSNAYENAVFSVAQDMVNNPITYAMTKMLNFMEANDINMNIPFINAMGFGVDLNANVQDLLRLGLGVGQAMSLSANIIQGLYSFGGMNLDNWGFQETTKRGSGIGFTTNTSLAQTSSSTYVTTQSSEDMQNSALNTATDDAEETKKITNKNSKSEFTFDDFYKATIGEQASAWVTTQDMFIRQVYGSTEEETNFLSVRDATSNKNFLSVRDEAGNGSIRAKLVDVDLPIPVILSDTLGSANNNVATTNIEVLKNALLSIFNDSFSMRIRSAKGSEMIPVDTELISHDKNKPLFGDSNTIGNESGNSGYRPGAINWN